MWIGFEKPIMDLKRGWQWHWIEKWDKETLLIGRGHAEKLFLAELEIKKRQKTEARREGDLPRFGLAGRGNWAKRALEFAKLGYTKGAQLFLSSKMMTDRIQIDAGGDWDSGPVLPFELFEGIVEKYKDKAFFTMSRGMGMSFDINRAGSLKKIHSLERGFFQS